MKRFLLLVLFLLGVSTVRAQSTSSGWKLVEAQSLSDLLSPTARYVAPSVDGAALAWVNTPDRALCLYDFAANGQDCSPFPQEFTGFNRFSDLSWSPDGKTISFTEDTFMLLLDSDIWTYVPGSKIFGDRTDDNFFGNFFSHSESSPTLDYLPTWNPAGGGVYFFRSVRAQDSTSLTLQYLPMLRTEPKQIVDLSADFPVFSVYRPAAISPDGKQMAVIVLGQKTDDARNGVWTINLEDGSLAQVMTMDDFKKGLPEWVVARSRLFPETVQWAGDQALVVFTHDLQSLGISVQSTAYYVDLAAQSVTPLVDFSAVPDMPAFSQDSGDPTQPIYQMPRAGVVTPDGKAYVYLSFGLSPQTAYVSALNLPPDGSAPVSIGKIDPFHIVPAADSAPAISADGKHALLFGYWLTLQPPA